jgi:hypothetical protein
MTLPSYSTFVFFVCFVVNLLHYVSWFILFAAAGWVSVL